MVAIVLFFRLASTGGGIGSGTTGSTGIAIGYLPSLGFASEYITEKMELHLSRDSNQGNRI
jgi:hypothetical protein